MIAHEESEILVELRAPRHRRSHWNRRGISYALIRPHRPIPMGTQSRLPIKMYLRCFYSQSRINATPWTTSPDRMLEIKVVRPITRQCRSTPARWTSVICASHSPVKSHGPLRGTEDPQYSNFSLGVGVRLVTR